LALSEISSLAVERLIRSKNDRNADLNCPQLSALTGGQRKRALAVRGHYEDEIAAKEAEDIFHRVILAKEDRREVKT